MFRKQYTHSGMYPENFNNIEKNAEVHLSGIGPVTIGNIGDGAEVHISSIGPVTIYGNVGENVSFHISGIGPVRFSNRPPESVMNKMHCSGIGPLTIPGGRHTSASAFSQPKSSSYTMFTQSKQPSTVMMCGFTGGVNLISSNGVITVIKDGVSKQYKGHSASNYNGKISIDGIAVTDNDPRQIKDGTTPAPRSSTSTINIVQIDDDTSSDSDENNIAIFNVLSGFSP